MRVAVIAGHTRSLVNFRGPLIRSMVDRGHEVIALGPPDAVVAPRIEAMGARFTPIDIRRTGMNPLADLKLVLGLRRTLAALRPDRVLSYTVKPVVYGSVAAHLAGVDHIASAITGLGHVFLDDTPRGRALRTLVCGLYKVALCANQVVFFQNPDDRAEFVRRGLVSEAQTRIIDGSGVDLRHYPEHPQPPGDPVFLFMGRFLEEKGLYELIEAARELKRRHPRARVRLLGKTDANPSSVSRTEVRHWQEEGLIEVVGWVEDVRMELAACTALVLPSWREGTPRSALEAMASGRAVITTDAPGCRETVIDGETGFLVGLRDADALAEAMCRVAADPSLARRMGRAGRRYAEHRYDVHRVNRSILGGMELA